MTKHKWDERVEAHIIKRVVDGELAVAKRNRSFDDDEFDSLIDLLDSVREPKAYSWMSDIHLPEFISHILTQASIDVDQYFTSKDFVEVYLQDESDLAKAAAEATKELINRTLNQRHLYHYLKYVRGKMYNNLIGRVYARCWWEKETTEQVVGYDKQYIALDTDVDGNPMEDETLQERAFRAEEVPITQSIPLTDRFNYDIIDYRDIYMSDEYTYSLQQKKWVVVHSKKSLESLKEDESSMGYFNLHLLDEKTTPTEGFEDRGKDTQSKENESNPIYHDYDLYERFGKFWCVIESVNDKGEPVKVSPGLKEDGTQKGGAKLLEAILTFAVNQSKKALIRFQVNPYRDSYGEPYRPLIRGLCYVHPTDDSGFGDGKNVRELQIAIDDTFNVTQDGTLLATLPTLLTKKGEDEDNPDVYIEPGHKIPLENPQTDLKWLQVPLNTTPAVQQIGMLRNMMQQVDAVFPTTMGDMPAMASTTATAVAGAESKTSKRSNYKSLTYENTFLVELYWMISQMTWQFAHPETGDKLMGQRVFDFHPDLDYSYKPVTSAIESEYAKGTKIKLWTQILSYATGIQHPDTVKLVNYILGQLLTYMGDEFVNFKDNLLDPKTPIQANGQAQGEGAQGIPATNQSGVPQSGPEMMAREGSNLG